MNQAMDPCHCLCCITDFASAFVWNTQYARSPLCEMSATQSHRELPNLSSGSELLQVMDCSAFFFLYTKSFMFLQEHNDLTVGTKDFRSSPKIVFQHG